MSGGNLKPVNCGVVKELRRHGACAVIRQQGDDLIQRFVELAVRLDLGAFEDVQLVIKPDIEIFKVADAELHRQSIQPRAVGHVIAEPCKLRRQRRKLRVSERGKEALVRRGLCCHFRGGCRLRLLRAVLPVALSQGCFRRLGLLRRGRGLRLCVIAGRLLLCGRCVASLLHDSGAVSKLFRICRGPHAHKADEHAHQQQNAHNSFHSASSSFCSRRTCPRLYTKQLIEFS